MPVAHDEKRILNTSAKSKSVDIALPEGHVRQLDGIRGLAIALVLAFHCYDFEPISKATSFGWSGVDLFFVLSGFLITGILIDSKSKPHYYRNFIVRRALRIFPLYYFALSLVFAAAFCGPFSFARKGIDSVLPYFLLYSQNIYIAFHGWLKSGGGVINHFWSLAQEEQFYLFWPLLVFRLSNRSLPWLCVAGIFVSLVFRYANPGNPFVYVFPLARMDSMFVGALSAILIRSRRELLNALVLPILVLSGAAILVGGISGHDFGYHAYFFMHAGYTVVDLFYGCVILLSLERGAIFGGALKTFFQQGWLTFLGKYSYGIYVYHWIFRCAFHNKFLEFFTWSLGNVVLANFIGSSVTIVLVIATSFLSFRLFEQRFLDLKHKFSK